MNGTSGIAISDLHSHALKKLPGIALKEGDVHFTEQGSAHLAEKVAGVVAGKLKP